jgi:uncharacterized membrane protein
VTLAWNRFLRAWVPLVLGSIIYFVIIEVISQGPLIAVKVALPDSPALGALVQLAGTLVTTTLGAFFMVGIIRITLEAARGQVPNLGTLFSGGDRFLPMLGLHFLLAIIVTVGFVLLIVPGVIAMLGLGFSYFFVADAEMGPIEAMRASWDATNGQKGKLFVLALLSFGIVLLGAMACGIGMLPASCIVYIAWTIVYTRLTGRDPALPDPSGR